MQANDASKRNLERLERTMTTATIRRNADGQQNLTDLRRELAKRSDLRVYRESGNWKTFTLVGNVWRVKTCPWNWTEQQAIQSALFGEAESLAEAKYHAGR
jgi:hypothetical protein